MKTESSPCPASRRTLLRRLRHSSCRRRREGAVMTALALNSPVEPGRPRFRPRALLSALPIPGPPNTTRRGAYRADSSGRRNASTEGFAMGTRRRRSDRAGRGILRSPGRPGVARREDRRRFWAAIAAGLANEDAARRASVSPAVGARWFREAGGMPPAALAPSSKPLCGRYLSFAEREEIALCRAQGQGVREVARRLGRAASTISRELRRNAATRGGGLDYRATAAQWHAEQAARRPKSAKLAANAALQTYVQ